MSRSPLPFPPSFGFHPLPPLSAQGCKQMKSPFQWLPRCPLRWVFAYGCHQETDPLAAWIRGEGKGSRRGQAGFPRWD